jgi:hypothetical protein
MTTPPLDSNLLAYLQAWRQYLEQMASSATMGFGTPAPVQWPGAAVPPPPPMPPMPPVPPAPPALAPPPVYSPAGPMDYTQQLLATLQAWRQYLEHNIPATPAPAPATAAYPQVPKEEPVPPPADGPQITPPAHTTPSQPSAPARRTGSAYAAENRSDAGGYGPPPPRSLYGGAAVPSGGSPAATTTWWDGGRPPAGTPKPHPIPLPPPDPYGTEVKVPPDLEPQAPMIPEGSAAPQVQAAPRAQLVQPSFDRTRSR